MESLLKLSGLLGEEDNHTDLGTLEKRLADKAASSSQRPSTSDTPTKSPGGAESVSQNGASESQTDISQHLETSRKSSVSSPKPPISRKNEEEVEALSDMMCSLVTNNFGETRFIGAFLICSVWAFAD